MRAFGQTGFGAGRSDCRVGHGFVSFRGNDRLRNEDLAADRTMLSCRQACFSAGRGDCRVCHRLMSLCGHNGLCSQNGVANRAMRAFGQTGLGTSRGDRRVGHRRVSFRGNDRLRDEDLAADRAMFSCRQTGLGTSRGDCRVGHRRVSFCGNDRLRDENLAADRAMFSCRQACFSAGRGYRRVGHRRVSFCGHNGLCSQNGVANRAMRAFGQACFSAGRGDCRVCHGFVSERICFIRPVGIAADRANVNSISAFRTSRCCRRDGAVAVLRVLRQIHANLPRRQSRFRALAVIRFPIGVFKAELFKKVNAHLDFIAYTGALRNGKNDRCNTHAAGRQDLIRRSKRAARRRASARLIVAQIYKAERVAFLFAVKGVDPDDLRAAEGELPVTQTFVSVGKRFSGNEQIDRRLFSGRRVRFTQAYRQAGQALCRRFGLTAVDRQSRSERKKQHKCDQQNDHRRQNLTSHLSLSILSLSKVPISNPHIYR